MLNQTCYTTLEGRFRMRHMLLINMSDTSIASWYKLWQCLTIMCASSHETFGSCSSDQTLRFNVPSKNSFALSPHKSKCHVPLLTQLLGRASTSSWLKSWQMMETLRTSSTMGMMSIQCKWHLTNLGIGIPPRCLMSRRLLDIGVIQYANSPTLMYLVTYLTIL